ARVRRYETASDFGADVQRHLLGEAIVAAPPSIAYRLRKFAHRHRTAVAVVALVGVTIVAGISGTTAFALREAKARTRAEHAETSARNEADALTRIVEFQEKELRDIDPKAMGERLARDLTAELKSSLARAKTDPEDAVR